jgi:hypothetical protein
VLLCAADENVQKDDNDNNNKESFLNLVTSHERSNEKFWGKENASAVSLNPVLWLGKNIVVEGSCYYGRQFTFAGYLKSANNWSEITGEKRGFYEEFNTIGRTLNASYGDTLGKEHFYRNYTRLVYSNTDNDFRIVAGDTINHNTIGFQSVLSGAGISIFRQSGDFSTINVGSPIVITKLSKVECRLNDEIISARIIRPGTYSINDLPEEAKLPGVVVKISDQMGKAELLTVDYFACYGRPAAKASDWDFTVLFPSRWDLDDPHRIKYRKRVRCSTNYRYSYSDNLMVGVGAQGYQNSYTFDATVIISGGYGVISPNIGFSNARKSGKGTKAWGAGVFYAIPKNEMGIHLETSFAFKEKGYGDLGIGAEAEEDYNALIEKCFATDALRRTRYKNTGKSSNYKQIVVRAYSDPIWGITPVFTFNGEWEGAKDDYSGNRLREYTLGFSTKVGCCSWVLSGGLTYDDPSKGRNLRSPDRRLTLACTVNLGSEICLQGSYVHYDDSQRRGYSCLTYTPEAIKGLELSGEFLTRPGVRDQTFTVKYDTKFFQIKVEEDVTNTYEDAEAKTPNSHNNKQRAFISTSFSRNGFGAYRSSGINTLRN